MTTRVGVWVCTPGFDPVELARQEGECREHATWMGWEVHGVYQDGACPPWASDPPGLRALLADLCDGLFHGVLIARPELMPQHPQVHGDLLAATSRPGRFLAFANPPEGLTLRAIQLPHRGGVVRGRG
ncbi:recombinase family protein [Carbonactinospora thermoautotrophica]|uniref:recombinase family protein n=1 Tax=Carbonactinospora thermoautotrophica TaxID=1469144 RepID=UPI003DA82658